MTDTQIAVEIIDKAIRLAKEKNWPFYDALFDVMQKLENDVRDLAKFCSINKE